MPEERSVRIAFNPEFPLARETTPADRFFWEMLKDNTQCSHIYNPTKQFLISCLIRNYKKDRNTSSAPIFDLNISNYRRIDNPDTIVDYIKTRRLNNEIYFIAKTSISGRQIATIAATINNDPLYTFTEEVTTSLYLQTDNSHPVRVFKLTTNNPETTTYFVIGSNQMLQYVFYTCLALVPKWFPHLFEGIDQTRMDALIKVFTAIGHMNNNEYNEAMRNCIDLCYDLEEKEIDFSTITSFLKQDITVQTDYLQNRIETYRTNANAYLQSYEDAIKAMQNEQCKLTQLLTEPKKDDETVIADAKSCKSIIDYFMDEHKHILTIKSKMVLDSKTIVNKILARGNTDAQRYYHIETGRQRRLFEDLWLKETLQIYFCTTFHKELSRSVPIAARAPKRTKATRNTIPNPHLHHYACYGSNKKILIEAATNNNLQYYLGALTACNSNLNTGDATVLRRFCSELLNEYYDSPILYDVETKTYTTPRERINSYEAI